MSRRWILVAMVWVGLAAARALTPAPPAIDAGRARLVVLQSDDWGFEGWFPDVEAVAALADLCEEVPAGLHAYCTSTLESATDIERLAGLLESHRDRDGLPAVLQANTVVAAIDVADRALPLRAFGPGEGPYARPDLHLALDEAIQRGVWWPELHGLTHHDLAAYRSAFETGDAVALRAAQHGVLAHRDWQRRWELGHDGGSGSTVAESVRRFALRFGRDPISVIAPDYRWNATDEDDFARAGLRIVQAKSEQIDPGQRSGTWVGRARKVLSRWRDRRRGRFLYLDRPAHLEPYGDADPESAQGADAALAAIRAAWNRNEAAVVSIHRVQLVNLDPTVVEAGSAQLSRLLTQLTAAGARFVVDAELAQLLRSGISTRRVGNEIVIRNYTRGVRWTSVDGERRAFPPGTHRRPAG